MVSARCQAMPHIPPRTCQPSRVQQLFRLSRSLFRPNRVPTEQQIDEALQLMRKIPLNELGLEERSCSASKSVLLTRDKVIEYLPVYEGGDFDIGIFCLPCGAVIPLHDHPGMTVMTRLLYGRMHVRAFDVLQRKESLMGRRWNVKLRDEFVMQEENCLSFLTPDKANIHTFRALTSCAMLDVLAPPYSPKRGRDCTYYKSTDPIEEFEDSDGFLKKEIMEQLPVIEVEACAPPWNFVVRRGQYTGSLPNLNEDTTN